MQAEDHTPDGSPVDAGVGVQQPATGDGSAADDADSAHAQDEPAYAGRRRRSSDPDTPDPMRIAPDPDAPPVVLLGPQREPTLRQVLDENGWHGRIGLINAGWRERETEDDLLTHLAGGNAVNLRLWERMQQVWEADPQFAEADRARRELLEEMQELYLLALDHVISAIVDIRQHNARHPQVQQVALDDALRIMRRIDARHLDRVMEIHDSFWERWTPHARPAVATFRHRIATELSEVEAVVVTGGHVQVLVGALHLFNVAPQIRTPVVAWGAGAMALTDTVVLFNDRAAHGPAVAEVFSTGVGLIHDVVALPSARQRLDLADSARMGLFARRFAPSALLLLDEGEQVSVEGRTELPPSARLIRKDGSVGRRTPQGVLP